MELRDYQQETIDGLFNWWADKPGEYPLCELPTAAGKTIIFSSLIKRLLCAYPELKVMILAHTKELVEQAEDKLLKVWPEAPTGIYCAGLKRKEIKQITCASRDSIRNKIMEVGQFDLVIIDEAHLISPKEETGYQKIIAGLKAKSPHLMVVGFTATPYRVGTGKIYGNKHIFTGLAYQATIKDLTEKGYLSVITSKSVRQSAVADTSGIKTTAGDFNKGDLSDLMADRMLAKLTVKDWYRKAFLTGRLSSVFFCVSIAHAELISEELESIGFFAPVVHGKTNHYDRAKVLANFDSGKIMAICNVGVLTTGWDCPRLDCIALLRPTKSLGLFIQMVGRGLRLHEDKENTLLLDYGGCIQRFGPIDEAKPVKPRDPETRTKECPKCHEEVGILKQKCPDCDFVFKKRPVKKCMQCNKENNVAATVCTYCDVAFFNHETEAYQGAVMSTETERVFKKIPVNFVSAEVKLSKAGKDYLKINYQLVDGISFYSAYLMIGYSGYPGGQATRLWEKLTIPFTVIPETPEEALSQITSDPAILKPIEFIIYDTKSKYKKIEEFYFKEAA